MAVVTWSSTGGHVRVWQRPCQAFPTTDVMSFDAAFQQTIGKGPLYNASSKDHFKSAEACQFVLERLVGREKPGMI